MSDIASQLSAMFGTPVPVTKDEASPHNRKDQKHGHNSSTTGLLAPTAHLSTKWITILGQYKSVTKMKSQPSLAAAIQYTDVVIKFLKKEGRKREIKALKDERQQFLSKREKFAWSKLKSLFTELKLSQKAYRRLKQESTDPAKALGILTASDKTVVSKMGANKLVELLGV